MGSHSKFSASAADRWTKCPASVARSEASPAIIDNKYSISGTATHFCLETFLNNHMHADGLKIIRGHLLEVFDEARVQRAEDAAWLILKDWMQYHDAELLNETKTKLDHIHPDFGGTFDAGIIALFDRLVIFDYKDGTKPVSPKSLQLITYALGIAHQHDYNFQDIELVVIQPRGKSADAKRALMSIDELEGYNAFFKRAIKAALDPKAKAVPGDHCYWCPARLNCPEKRKADMEKQGRDFDDDYQP